MARCKVKVVTGFVPITGHPRSQETYKGLGQQLSDALGEASLVVYFERISDLWLAQFLEKLPALEPPLRWAKADNPAKNSLEWHCVQYQKFAWLVRAANEDQESDAFVWIDYGIMSQPGITAEVVRDFLRKIQKNDFALPGCWPAVLNPPDEHPYWRFLGSLMVVPRVDTHSMLRLMQAYTRVYVRAMQQVTFEINILARIEPLLSRVGLRWYKADHNASQFANYGK